jgi:dTDP-4-amino-4,6-dideoxygalactose transaminase
LVAPYRFAGDTALSVDSAITRSTPHAIAASSRFFAPLTFVCTASIGLYSQIGTCFIAAAFPDGGVLAPPVLPDRESAYHLFAVAIAFPRFGVTRDAVMRALAAAGIGTQVHYIPLLSHPLHASRCPGELRRPRPGADHYYARTLSLPLFPTMTAADVARVVDELQCALGVPR